MITDYIVMASVIGWMLYTRWAGRSRESFPPDRSAETRETSKFFSLIRFLPTVYLCAIVFNSLVAWLMHHITPATFLKDTWDRVTTDPLSLAHLFLSWALLFEILSRIRIRGSALSFLNVSIAMYLVQAPLVTAAWLLSLRVRSDTLNLPTENFFNAYSDSEVWLHHVTRYPDNLLTFIWSAIWVGVAFTMLRLPEQSGEGTFRFPASAETNGGQPMEKHQSETTRFLCASAFTAGASFRTGILHSLREPNRAVAPEAMIDLELVAGVCAYAEKRHNGYIYVYLAAALTSALVTIAEPYAGIFLLLISSGVIGYIKARNERVKILPSFKPNTFNSDTVRQKFTTPLHDGFHAAIPLDSQNLIVYSGYTPFVGSGYDTGGWSFNISLDKMKEHSSNSIGTADFTIDEIYDAIDQSARRLRIADMENRDVFFVSGTDIRDDRTLLPEIFARPRQVLSEELADKYRSTGSSRIRCFKRFRIFDWGGEIVTSSFIRCIFQGRSLSLEFRRYVMPPLRAAYRKVDYIPTWNWKAAVSTFFISLTSGPFMAAFSPLIVIALWQRGLQELFFGPYPGRRKEIERNPAFDYGSHGGYRMRFTSDAYFHYFQQSDADLYGKLLEREALDCLVAFLDAHGIDTSDIKERQTSILNNGVIVQGGDVKAENLAVGAGSKAVKSTRFQRIRQLTRKAS